MRRNCCGFVLALFAVLSPGVGIRGVAEEAKPSYAIAFASFGPLNTDLFVADAGMAVCGPTPLNSIRASRP